MTCNHKLLIKSAFILSLFCSTTYGMEQLAIESASNITVPSIEHVYTPLNNPVDRGLLEAPAQQDANPLLSKEQGFELTPAIRQKIEHEANQSRVTFVSYKLECGINTGESITTEKLFPHNYSQPRWKHDDTNHKSTSFIETFFMVDQEKVLVKEDETSSDHKFIESTPSVPVGEPWQDAENNYQKMQHKDIWERTGIDGERYEVVIDETLATPIPKPVLPAPVVAPSPVVQSYTSHGGGYSSNILENAAQRTCSIQ